MPRKSAIDTTEHDGVRRCDWAGNDPVYCRYHDEEWGVPVHDDRKLFEMLILEGFQAGLSWITILKRRGRFRAAFDNWDWEAVAAYMPRDVRRLLGDAGIIRNRLKIESAVNNARRFMEVRAEFGAFDRYIWKFTGGKTLRRARPYANWKAIPPRTTLSDAIAADLKKRGFSFVGSTIVYAHMQATGMVDDHHAGCFKCVR